MTLRIAAVGLGGLGNVLADVFADVDGVEIAAGVDVDDDARAAFEAAHGVPTYGDVAALLDAEDLDAVSVVTPHTLHYEQTRACLDAGLDVLLEKPMVTDVGDAVDLVERADAGDLVLQVGYQRHFDPTYRELKRIIDEGRIGEVHMVSCWLEQNWFDVAGGTWRTDPALSGGGMLYDSGSHLLDAMLWTTGADPGVVTALMDFREEGVDSDTAIAATLRGPDRPITASIGVTGDGVGLEEGLYVWGTEGYVTLHEGDLEVVEPSARTTVTPRSDTSGMVEKVHAFVEAVRGERENEVPGEYGLKVTALTEAAYASAERGEPVDAQQLVADARSD